MAKIRNLEIVDTSERITALQDDYEFLGYDVEKISSTTLRIYAIPRSTLWEWRKRKRNKHLAKLARTGRVRTRTEITQ